MSLHERSLRRGNWALLALVCASAALPRISQVRGARRRAASVPAASALGSPRHGPRQPARWPGAQSTNLANTLTPRTHAVIAPDGPSPLKVKCLRPGAGRRHFRRLRIVAVSSLAATVYLQDLSSNVLRARPSTSSSTSGSTLRPRPTSAPTGGVARLTGRIYAPRRRAPSRSMRTGARLEPQSRPQRERGIA